MTTNQGPDKMAPSKKTKNKAKKARWRTLSPASFAAKVALRDKRQAQEAALKAQKEAAAAGGTAATETTGTKDAQKDAQKAAKGRRTPRQKRRKGDRKKETARVDGEPPAKDLLEASTEEAAVASTDAAMPDAPEVEAKIPGEDKDKAQAPQKPEAEAKAKEEAEPETTPPSTTRTATASSGDSDNGGARVLRSTRSRAK